MKLLAIFFSVIICFSFSSCKLISDLDPCKPNPKTVSMPLLDKFKAWKNKIEIERIKQDWGVYKQKNYWIYQP